MRGQKLGHEGVGGSVGQRGQSAFLNHATASHQRNFVSKEGGFSEVVGDHDDRGLNLVEDLSQLPLELDSGHGVDRAQRLVEEEDVRICKQRAHQRDALPLASGELPGIAIEDLLPKLHQRAEFIGPLRNRAFFLAKGFGEEPDVLSRSEVGKKSATLNDVAESLAPNPFGILPRQLFVAEHDGPTVVGNESEQQAQERRLVSLKSDMRTPFLKKRV